ncbi:hypothetical protein GWI33_004906 [Rhynchophorus ferrugineus]|uniref:Uncharacterized protein n=1 Tax=Rhynchophorus ferrugineus TaxID=354439 RepID=A0A834IIA5_RHYFE|nr:hypothetical protein GWI33_004906 [Rhynchophorus ferrugineus]
MGSHFETSTKTIHPRKRAELPPVKSKWRLKVGVKIKIASARVQKQRTKENQPPHPTPDLLSFSRSAPPYSSASPAIPYAKVAIPQTETTRECYRNTNRSRKLIRLELDPYEVGE